MHAWSRALSAVTLAVLMSGATLAQTHGEREELTATAIVNNEFATGAGTVIMRINRWSTERERTALVRTLQQEGSDELLEALRSTRPVGTIRTPDSLAYDLRYAHQSATPEGGRRIVLATDRPIGFWEARNQPRTIDYPFTVIQIELDRNGEGRGTLSYATKVTAYDNTIVLENYGISPVMLTEVESSVVD